MSEEQKPNETQETTEPVQTTEPATTTEPVVPTENAPKKATKDKKAASPKVAKEGAGKGKKGAKKGDSTQPPPKKGEAKPGKPKKEKPPKQVSTDVFGCRLGSNHNTINTILQKAKEPLTMKQIKELSNTDITHYNHMKHLESKGFLNVIKDKDDGNRTFFMLKKEYRLGGKKVKDQEQAEPEGEKAPVAQPASVAQEAA